MVYTRKIPDAFAAAIAAYKGPIKVVPEGRSTMPPPRGSTSRDAGKPLTRYELLVQARQTFITKQSAKAAAQDKAIQAKAQKKSGGAAKPVAS
jgi:hypothetical protein